MQDGIANSLGFALVGCGRAGERHSMHIDKYGRYLAACDIEPAAIGQFRRSYGVEGFEDYSEMLQAVQGKADVIAVCTPNYLHSEHSIQAFEAGYHVICE